MNDTEKRDLAAAIQHVRQMVQPNLSFIPEVMRQNEKIHLVCEAARKYIDGITALSCVENSSISRMQAAEFLGKMGNTFIDFCNTPPLTKEK